MDHYKSKTKCKMVHFVVQMNQHTKMHLGDCSYLDRCPKLGRGQICRSVHYMVEDDYKDINPRTLRQADGSKASAEYIDEYAKKHEITVIDPQWLQCDVRNLDVSVRKLSSANRLCTHAHAHACAHAHAHHHQQKTEEKKK